MNRNSITWLCLLLPVLLTGCDWMPGAPKKSDVWQPASANLDFDKLYRVNCLACHSDGSNTAASIPMNFPTYLAFVSEEQVKKVITEGIAHTTMPAFGIEHGGPLTDQQVDVLTSGIMAWRQGAERTADMPAYAGGLGDVARGAEVYAVACASCHGPDGGGGEDAGSIIDPAYLSLVSDQYLRTVTVVGRPDLNMPDWRNMAPGRVLNEQDVSDLVAWMISHRLPAPSIDPASVTPPPDTTDSDEPIYE